AGMRAGMSSGFILSVLPEWFGSPERYMGPAAPIEWTGAFVGAAWPLVMLGLLAGRARGPVRAAGVLLGLGLLAGYSAPLVSDALQALPVFRYAVNTRLLLLALLAAAVLAGFGLDALGTLREARERRRLALAVLAPLCALFAALVCAAHLGLVAASNAPGRPEVSAITEAGLLPTAQMAPLFEGLPPPSQEEPSLAVGGWIVSAVPPMTIKLLYGSTNRSLVAQWKPAPAAAPATYVFRTAIPRSELLPERTMVRVLAIGTDGSFVVSGQLASPDDEEPWLSFPARPAPGGTPWQLALLLAVAGLLAVRPGSGLALSSVRIAFAALIGLSLLPFASGMVPLLAREMFYPHSAVIDVLREASPEGRTVCMLPSIVGPEIMTFYGVSDARSYDGMGPLHAMRLASTALGLARRSHESANAGLLDQPDLPLLGLMAVKVLTYLGPPPAGMRPVPVPAEKDPRQRYQLVENPWFLPRARLVSGAVVQADDDLALEALRDPGFPRSRCVVLAQGSPAPAAADAIGSARIVTSRPDRVRVEIAPSADGWLLLADTYFPGWVATVDGQPREIVRANVGLRAVAVHPGERVVEFRYEPASFRAGAWLSIATAIGLALASASVAWASRRRR
ncbi:MAG TPA: YfhO family protein, partial [Planctomycetota bacterium]|nr:YfhO family protein [Planctomycetota bacterium]